MFRKLLWKLERVLEKRAEKRASSWLLAKEQKKDWNAIVAVLIPDITEKTGPIKKAYLEHIQYNAEITLSVAGCNDQEPNSAANASRSILAAYEKQPSNRRLAEVTIDVARHLNICKIPELKAIHAEMARLVKQHDDAGLYRSYKPHGLEYLLRNVFNIDPIRDKQAACVHRWRKANVSGDGFDICDNCGLMWNYFDGRGDAIENALSRRPKKGISY